MIGLSYGGDRDCGQGRKGCKFRQIPGFLVKYRIFEEAIHFPGVALGYDHRVMVEAPIPSEFEYKGNIYNHQLLSGFKQIICCLQKIQFGIHGALTYSMEDLDKVTWPKLSGRNRFWGQ
jgi:hypothetical protein